MTGAFIREKNEIWMQTEGHVKTQAEIEVMLPQDKECQEPQARKGKEGFSPRALGTSVTLVTVWFWILASWPGREKNFIVLSNPVCGTLLERPKKSTNSRYQDEREPALDFQKVV